MKQVLKLTLEDAKKMMDGAINKAIEIGVDMDIAIVDDGGHLMLFTSCLLYTSPSPRDA